MKTCIAAWLLLLALPAWAEQPKLVALAASAKVEPYWSFWRGETTAGYRQKMLEDVRTLLAETRADTRVVELAEPSVPDRLNRDRAPWPQHQTLCRNTDANLLLSLRVEDPVPVFSPWQADLFGDRGDVASAHWPNLYLIAYDCSRGSRSTEQLSLSPRAQDRFVFEADLLAYTHTFWDKVVAHSAPGND